MKIILLRRSSYATTAIPGRTGRGMLDRLEYLLQPLLHLGHANRAGAAFDVTSSQSFGSSSRMAARRIVSVSAGMGLAVLVLLVANTPAWGQFPDDPHDASRQQGYSSLGLREFNDSVARSQDFVEHNPSGPATISKDALRYPLSAKARRRLVKALHLAALGEHPAAIKELRETLVKEPSSAPYAQSLLGVEYVRNQQFAEARNSFEEAVRLKPHESANHSNLGASLAVAGDWNSAEQEARKALELDADNSKAKSLLDLAVSRKPRTAEGSPQNFSAR
jgi:tetratricopeptide (TPR) repeat protein